MTTQVDNVFSPEQAYIDWTQYARGRAPYQKRMFDIIYDYHSKGGAGWDLVIDHGAGDCTLAPFLLQRFKHVEATDASEAQLKIGEERLRKAGIDETRLTIRTCPAGSNPGPDASADMVTAATCVHFFDIPAFLTDAARLLKPGGTLAIFTSGGIPVIIDRDQSGMTKLSATGEMLMEWFSKTVMTELARVSVAAFSAQQPHCLDNLTRPYPTAEPQSGQPAQHRQDCHSPCPLRGRDALRLGRAGRRQKRLHQAVEHLS